MSIKGTIFTMVKKSMTRKMYKLYYTENEEALQKQEEYEKGLAKVYKHLDACKFKEKGWPCPTCPECCFHGKDHDDMMTVMNYVQKWMEEHPDRAKYMKPPKAFHKH